ncbi:MAG: VanW family protein [Patescibacteria group bacterium]|nr:VanW family protein [Patescibacteria group bacterium]
MKKVFKFTLVFLSVILFLAVVTASAFLIYYNRNFQGKVYPNVIFEKQNLQGWDKNKVNDLIAEKEKDFSSEIELGYDGKSVQTKISDLGFVWNDTKTLDEIINYGKRGNYVENFLVFIRSYLIKKEIVFAYDFDKEKITQYLKEIATSVDKEPVDGRFEMKNGKVSEFVMGNNGAKLLIDESIEEIKNAIIDQDNKVKLRVQIVEAKNVEDMGKMGIKELVATGQSNFFGSPNNRVHNIAVGAQVFNGILIKPGENFSFITYLGEVSAKTGYLPELVIKEDKTIPEYGGGLCQVSTTFFRTAINAGFPILERTEHAYRVVYYEPAGFDSTIYDPKPDLIFKNDTANYILIQTRISSTELFVDFYGTNDGRKVEVSKSVVYNFVAPGDPIMIETTDLAPGEKKQTDIAHTGADAYFTRKITYADGKAKDDRFDSHYIPWRAKFLVGKEPEKPADAPPADSSTTSNSDSTQAPATS